LDSGGTGYGGLGRRFGGLIREEDLY